ncbi:MBL fold metallo-hydrolase [Spirochaetia bacterium]|nr:MBL fold metallo-hydrolase [Spirochaetia bacterium]
MAAQFQCNEYFPGVYHISDVMGVQFTLIVLKDRALLFDTGYGILDPKPFVAELLKKHNLDLSSLSVILSHAHHDHILGARWFDHFFLHQDDFAAMDVYTQYKYRSKVYEKAVNSNAVPADFDEEAFYKDEYRSKAVKDIPSFEGIDILHVPGHTPGSLLVYIPQYKLLLTTDNWNPTTWLFFTEAIPVYEYAENMKKLLSIDFSHVLCSHSSALISGERLRKYINGLTPETFASAVKAETPYPEFDVLLCHPEPDTNFFFRKED